MLASRPALERKNSFPRYSKSDGHDFRKEFRGSILERKAKWFQKRKGWLSSIICKFADLSAISRKGRKIAPQAPLSQVEALPVELLMEIFARLDSNAGANCRAVCKRWKNIIEGENRLWEALFPVRQLSRLTIRGVTKRGRRQLEMRWVDYESQSSNVLLLSSSLPFLPFAFARFDAQRILLQDLQLTDSLIDFLRLNLLCCPALSPTQLSLISIDFRDADTLCLHRLLAVVGKSLEVLEIQSPIGLEGVHFSDAHVTQLDAARLRRLVVDGTGGGGTLALGDSSLMTFMAARNFPTLVLDRCAVTTGMICDYTEEWLRSAERDENAVHRHQVCTVKRCGSVSGGVFETECARRGLNCRRSSVTNTHTIYNVQAQHRTDEFTVALCPAPSRKSVVMDDD